ncbi:MAG: MFS transporter [Fibrobacter sp.]|nr:MFS transporter [Fibrobacter sp.]
MISTLLLLIIYLSFISLGLPDGLLGSAWPAMYKNLSVPMHYAGIISMITAGGAVISALFSGKIINRFGTGIITFISVFITAITLIGFSLSHDFVVLCFWAISLGLGAGTVDSALNNYVAVHYKAKHMNWLHCFWGVGASIGPLIMSAHLVNGGMWTQGYRTVGIIQCCLVIVLLISLPLWSKNAAQKQQVSTKTDKPVTYRTLLGIPGLKHMLIVFFCYCTIEAVTGLWGSSYLVAKRNVSPENAARWIALFFIGITAGRFISGFLSMKFTNRQMVRLGQWIIACGILALFLPMDSFLMLTFFIIGLGCAPIFPSLIHETPENFSSRYSQIIVGMQMSSAYIGITIMPLFFGRLAGYLDFSIFPLFLGFVLIIMIVITEMGNRSIDVQKKILSDKTIK